MQADPVPAEPASGRFRLRDLDRRGRIGAAVLALALVLVPVVAAAVNHGRWLPQGDDALIEVRARDTGTSRTPLVGQPSTSGTYGEQTENVAHPGPIEFYALALPVRALGPTTGFLLTTATIVSGSMLIGAWVVFRQAGPRAGCLAAALMALAALTAGAAGQVEPISSNAGRFPLLAAAILAWALLCGDVKLAPLAAGVWSYAAQQHLSILPAAAVVAGLGLAGIAWSVWQAARADPDDDGGRPELRSHMTWIAIALGVGLLLWSPVLGQQATGDPGNLSALASYSGDGARDDLGLRSAFEQVAHVLGPIPFLGRSGVRGWDIVAPLAGWRVALTWSVAIAVLAVGAWWARADRRLVSAVLVAGALALAGLATGTNIPDSPEQGRLAFYHWAFALSFFVLFVVVWLGAKLAPRLTPQVTHGRRATAFALALAVVLVVALVPVVVDRQSDRLQQPIATASVRRFVDEIRRGLSDAGHEGPLLVQVRGDDRYIQLGDTVAARLIADGYDARLPRSSKGFAHDDRLVDPCDAPYVLDVSLEMAGPPALGIPTIASVDAAPGLDRAALGRLVDAAQGSHVELGADLERALDRMPGDQGNLVGATIAFRLAKDPERILLNRANLELLIHHPIASPALAREDLEALLDSLPEGAAAVNALRLRAYRTPAVCPTRQGQG